MTAILCLGNGDVNASNKAKIFSLKNSVEYNGLLDTELETYAGCYHTSIYDLSYDRIKNISKNFDRVIVLDQDKYQTDYDFYVTIELAQDIEEVCPVTFLDPSYRNEILDEIKNNPAFCLTPYFGIYSGDSEVAPCCYYEKEFTKFDNKFDYAADSAFTEMRTDVLNKVPGKGCVCWRLEKVGAVSFRKRFSREWSFRLNQKKIIDLKPVVSYYDLRLGNKCNLMCRMCRPNSSDMIAREYFKIGLVKQDVGTFVLNDVDIVNLDELDHTKTVYVSGGEPTINDGFVDWLKKCIQLGKTDFELIVQTNAVVITDDFLDVAKNFSRLRFEVSVDGFGIVNKYIRWPSDWNKVTNNVKRLYAAANGRISFNSVPSIYNMGNIYSLFEYIDQTYPEVESHMSYAFDPAYLSPWKFPNKELALEDLEKVKTLNLYRNKEFRSKIDGLVKLITEHQLDPAETAKFFSWNDKLDQSRGILLADYIPELENCRPK